jgi:hypothetical protein
MSFLRAPLCCARCLRQQGRNLFFARTRHLFLSASAPRKRSGLLSAVPGGTGTWLFWAGRSTLGSEAERSCSTS